MFEHEIPKGSALYFGKYARKKRQIEASVAKIFYEDDFEEILTPIFSYSGHQAIENTSKLITISSEHNTKLALRADSTLDVVRIISKRLGRTTKHRKWFYIQDIFAYPSSQRYQIGCEWLKHDNILDVILLNIKIFEELKIETYFQISNINIPALVAKNLKLNIEVFQNLELDYLLGLDCSWLDALLKVKDLKTLEQSLELAPQFLREELEKLQNLVKKIPYEKIIISPLYCGNMKYYDDIYFRSVKNNLTISRGGAYKSEGMRSLGFALFTNNLLKSIEE